jgi:hypothetical protein
MARTERTSRFALAAEEVHARKLGQMIAAMQFLEFAQFHLPALEADEVRFNIQIFLITAAMNDFPAGLQYWTLGDPGHCAIQHPGHAILLGALHRDECYRLARETEKLHYPGVVGSDDTANWFVEQAKSSGITFGKHIPPTRPRPYRISAVPLRTRFAARRGGGRRTPFVRVVAGIPPRSGSPRSTAQAGKYR